MQIVARMPRERQAITPTRGDLPLPDANLQNNWRASRIVRLAEPPVPRSAHEQERSMHLQLTEEDWRAVRRALSEPIRLTDPETQEVYLLVRAGIFDRLRALVYDDGDFEPTMGYALADEVMKEDWDDPKMAEYDRYEEYKP
jgi:hypothetical protein